jgi:lysophospholipase L1-like esterase
VAHTIAAVTTDGISVPLGAGSDSAIATDRKLVFLGDSITCGYGLLNIPDPNGHGCPGYDCGGGSFNNEVNTLAYGSLVSKVLPRQ